MSFLAEKPVELVKIKASKDNDGVFYVFTADPEHPSLKIVGSGHTLEAAKIDFQKSFSNYLKKQDSNYEFVALK